MTRIFILCIIITNLKVYTTSQDIYSLYYNQESRVYVHYLEYLFLYYNQEPRVYTNSQDIYSCIIIKIRRYMLTIWNIYFLYSSLGIWSG